MLAIASKIKCKRNFSNTPLTFKRTLHISHQESLTGSRHSTYISTLATGCTIGKVPMTEIYHFCLHKDKMFLRTCADCL